MIRRGSSESPNILHCYCCGIEKWNREKLMPEVGRRWAWVGSMMPPVVFSSASATLQRTKSPVGFTCMDFPRWVINTQKVRYAYKIRRRGRLQRLYTFRHAFLDIPLKIGSGAQFLWPCKALSSRVLSCNIAVVVATHTSCRRYLVRCCLQFLRDSASCRRCQDMTNYNEWSKYRSRLLESRKALYLPEKQIVLVLLMPAGSAGRNPRMSNRSCLRSCVQGVNTRACRCMCNSHQENLCASGQSHTQALRLIGCFFWSTKMMLARNVAAWIKRASSCGLHSESRTFLFQYSFLIIALRHKS